MYMRLSRIAELTDEQTDAMVEGFTDGTYPQGDLLSREGCRGFAAGADREHGKVCLVSLWSTHNDLRNSKRVAEAARAARLGGIGREAIADEYEIMLTRPGPDPAGAETTTGCIRLCRVAGLVDTRVKEMVDGFVDNAQGVEGLQGFAGYWVAADPAPGRVTSISRWRTRADMEASERIAASQREERLAAVKPQRRPLIDFYDLIAVGVPQEVAAR